MKPHCFLAVPFVSGTDTSKASRLDNEKAVPGYYSVAHSCYGSSFELSTDKYTARRREQELDIRSMGEISRSHGWKLPHLKRRIVRIQAFGQANVWSYTYSVMVLLIQSFDGR